MEYYNKPATNHPADKAIHAIVGRLVANHPALEWSGWAEILSNHPGADFRLGQLYSLFASRDGDWLTFRPSQEPTR